MQDNLADRVVLGLRLVGFRAQQPAFCERGIRRVINPDTPWENDTCQ